MDPADTDSMYVEDNILAPAERGAQEALYDRKIDDGSNADPHFSWVPSHIEGHVHTILLGGVSSLLDNVALAFVRLAHVFGVQAMCAAASADFDKVTVRRNDLLALRRLLNRCG